jgi:hypothetical protein
MNISDYKPDDKVIVVSQPIGLSSPSLINRVGVIQRVWGDIEWFCDLKIGDELFNSVPFKCLIPNREIEIVPSPRPEDDKPQWPTYHEMLDYLCRELGVPGSPTFWEAVAWVKQDLDTLVGIRGVLAEAEIARRKKRIG